MKVSIGISTVALMLLSLSATAAQPNDPGRSNTDRGQAHAAANVRRNTGSRDKAMTVRADAGGGNEGERAGDPGNSGNTPASDNDND